VKKENNVLGSTDLTIEKSWSCFVSFEVQEGQSPPAGVRGPSPHLSSSHSRRQRI